MATPNQLYTLRGHLNDTTCTEIFYIPEDNEPTLISGDSKGWIIWWNLSRKRPIGTWKGHDSNIVTIKQLDNNILLTHGKDSEIKMWDILNFKNFSTNIPMESFNDTTYFNVKETESMTLAKNDLIKKYPVPQHVSIPVNTLNYCNIDYFNGYLVTPSTRASENFDIYSIFRSVDEGSLDSRLGLKRVIADFDPWSLYEKLVQQEQGVEAEINSPLTGETKRDKFGIMMKILYINDDHLFIGYESGHLLRLKIDYSPSNIIIDKSPKVNSDDTSKSGLSGLFKTKTIVDKTILVKEPKITLEYINSAHKPNPILSMAYHNNYLLSGSVTQKLIIHDFAKKDFKEVKLRKSGIQNILGFENSVIVSFWDGLIKSFDFGTFNTNFKIVKALPVIQSLESNIGNSHDIPSKSDKSKLCTLMLAKSIKNVNKLSNYKSLVKSSRNNVGKNLLFAGYADGSIVAYGI